MNAVFISHALLFVLQTLKFELHQNHPASELSVLSNFGGEMLVLSLYLVDVDVLAAYASDMLRPVSELSFCGCIREARHCDRVELCHLANRIMLL